MKILSWVVLELYKHVGLLADTVGQGAKDWSPARSTLGRAENSRVWWNTLKVPRYRF
jgi:hypothetical protein